MECRRNCRRARSTSAWLACRRRCRAPASTRSWSTPTSAAERGVLAHRLHALLDRSLLLVGREGRAVARDGAVEARVRLDSRDQPPGRDRQHAEARHGDRPTARDAGSKRVGVLELDALPAGLYDDIIAVSPSSELTDATALFAAERRHLDAAERKLIERADAIAMAALEQVNPRPGPRCRHARRSGRETCAP